MTQELGRIQPPSAERFAGKRKLLLVPLFYASSTQNQEGQKVLHKYWAQMQYQVESLESRLGPTRHIYYESLPEGGDQGLKLLESADPRAHRFIQAKCQAGATLESAEDADVLAEALDLQRCLMLSFASEAVARKVEEWYAESLRKRYEHMSKRIHETLKENEVVLLLIGERHQVQFPLDVEVFYVSPPALDEYHRWLQDWLAQQEKGAETEAGEAR